MKDSQGPKATSEDYRDFLLSLTIDPFIEEINELHGLVTICRSLQKRFRTKNPAFVIRKALRLLFLVNEMENQEYRVIFRPRKKEQEVLRLGYDYESTRLNDLD